LIGIGNMKTGGKLKKQPLKQTTLKTVNRTNYETVQMHCLCF